jgi:hypothetical protein
MAATAAVSPAAPAPAPAAAVAKAPAASLGVVSSDQVHNFDSIPVIDISPMFVPKSDPDYAAKRRVCTGATTTAAIPCSRPSTNRVLSLPPPLPCLK